MGFNYKEKIPETHPKERTFTAHFSAVRGAGGLGAPCHQQDGSLFTLTQESCCENCFPYLQTTLTYKAITQLQTLPF